MAPRPTGQKDSGTLTGVPNRVLRGFYAPKPRVRLHQPYNTILKQGNNQSLEVGKWSVLLERLCALYDYSSSCTAIPGADIV